MKAYNTWSEQNWWGPGSGYSGSSNHGPGGSSLGDLISAAQSEAASRRSGKEIDVMIQNAQMKNIPAAQEAAAAAPKRADAPSGKGRGGRKGVNRPRMALRGKPISAEELLGNWVDLLGNSVLVYSTDAWQLRLTASMSRPPRPDVQLSVWHDAIQGWICGNAVLDASTSRQEQLQWVAPDGRTSVWMRGRE